MNEEGSSEPDEKADYRKRRELQLDPGEQPQHKELGKKHQPALFPVCKEHQPQGNQQAEERLAVVGNNIVGVAIKREVIENRA